MTDNAKYYIPAGTTASGVYDTVITPEKVGWEWSGLKIANLRAGEETQIATGETELLVLPLDTGASVTLDGEKYMLAGRESVFASATDYLYVPRHKSFTLRAEKAGRIALPATKATSDKPVRYCPAGEAVTALRGSGRSSRQVTNYALGNAVETSHLLVCEVLTPGGNWSSYPPHKHEEHGENERELEEIYYFEVRGGRKCGCGCAEKDSGAFGLQEVYSSPKHQIDVSARVRSGDVVAVPFGYHGPSAAAPFYDLYYLNVMGGPAEDAVWKAVDDPYHGWQRAEWEKEDVDRRLPFYTI
ncbi:5-deoxy-glucuronate isomerase [Arcanobacterium sp. S3PF19]|uniref:5-deoxy-glucuronate isomerase n=1 Tax=Arcanobacterium sp. S3PF19 TaxID=1219585 RepID=UPI00050E351D|nr:5-deoxy-glucuronate isomerase [Arcanobacterium sp. S3PF19]KGF06032.1 5-deoxyglucuronate isomerase [Arcanobacterium sp. S3PF19]